MDRLAELKAAKEQRKLTDEEKLELAELNFAAKAAKQKARLAKQKARLAKKKDEALLNLLHLNNITTETALQNMIATYKVAFIRKVDKATDLANALDRAGIAEDVDRKNKVDELELHIEETIEAKRKARERAAERSAKKRESEKAEAPTSL